MRTRSERRSPHAVYRRSPYPFAMRRATSRELNLENLHKWAALKGITVVGTGDFTHPSWFAELQEKLEPAEEGLYRLKNPWRQAVEQELPPTCRNEVRFLLSVEISSIYKKNGRTRKVHNLVMLPDLGHAEVFNRRLGAIGNLKADGRPILGLDSHDLLAISLDVCPDVLFVPAHIWTPHFAVLGSESGFDSLEECFDELLPHVFALETGLSSDPPMNTACRRWIVSPSSRIQTHTRRKNWRARRPVLTRNWGTQRFTRPSRSAIDPLYGHPGVLPRRGEVSLRRPPQVPDPLEAQPDSPGRGALSGLWRQTDGRCAAPGRAPGRSP